nr:hypothetical protein [uncultured Schaedlerella sp.]
MNGQTSLIGGDQQCVGDAFLKLDTPGAKFRDALRIIQIIKGENFLKELGGGVLFGSGIGKMAQCLEQIQQVIGLQFGF